MSSGIAFGLAICIVGGLSLIGGAIFELRKTPKQEAEMIEREDAVMSKVSDDSREMAKWVP